ncbi:MAG: helix-turn-helix domain-containing protein [Lachnospiraceae bacterium]|nr:helix-turn-helix domain-containing protein [Lachnospiraceae bacterium]
MEKSSNYYPELPPTLTVRDIKEILRISLGGAYRLVNSGEIRAKTVGRQFRIPRDEFLRYLRSNT